jgi:hypothetical protein
VRHYNHIRLARLLAKHFLGEGVLSSRWVSDLDLLTLVKLVSTFRLVGNEVFVSLIYLLMGILE